jgi:hypothetical protein
MAPTHRHARSSERSIVECVALFVVLTIIYALYMRGVVDAARAPIPPDLLRPLLLFCLISGAPFAALAFVDRDWHSELAAPVALTAWAVVFGYFSHTYGQLCPTECALLFLPLMLSALAAHAIGGRRHQEWPLL